MLVLLLVALSLGLSNFAAAVGIGVTGINTGTRLRVGLIFGVFEARMHCSSCRGRRSCGMMRGGRS